MFIEWDGTTFYFPISAKMVTGGSGTRCSGGHSVYTNSVLSLFASLCFMIVLFHIFFGVSIIAVIRCHKRENPPTASYGNRR